MANVAAKRRTAREHRHRRVRAKVWGTLERPRLNVFRSLSHIYAQVIDDDGSHTLVSASTIDPEVRAEVAGKNRTDAAKVIGRLVAERAQAAGIKQVVFDRGGYKYHGRVKALADAAREAGLEF
jgi:large subunit ribosomal protein L18